MEIRLPTSRGFRDIVSACILLPAGMPPFPVPLCAENQSTSAGYNLTHTKGRVDNPAKCFLTAKCKYTGMTCALSSVNQGSERCNSGVRFTPTSPPYGALAGWNSKMPWTEQEVCSSWSQEEGEVCTCSYFNKWLAIFRYIWKDPSVKSVLRECQEGMSQGEQKVSRTKVLISQMFQSTKKWYGKWPYQGPI